MVSSKRKVTPNAPNGETTATKIVPSTKETTIREPNHAPTLTDDDVMVNLLWKPILAENHCAPIWPVEELRTGDKSTALGPLLQADQECLSLWANAHQHSLPGKELLWSHRRKSLVLPGETRDGDEESSLCTLDWFQRGEFLPNDVEVLQHNRRLEESRNDESLQDPRREEGIEWNWKTARAVRRKQKKEDRRLQKQASSKPTARPRRRSQSPARRGRRRSKTPDALLCRRRSKTLEQSQRQRRGRRPNTPDRKSSRAKNEPHKPSSPTVAAASKTAATTTTATKAKHEAKLSSPTVASKKEHKSSPTVASKTTTTTTTAATKATATAPTKAAVAAAANPSAAPTATPKPSAAATRAAPTTPTAATTTATATAAPSATTTRQQPPPSSGSSFFRRRRSKTPDRTSKPRPTNSKKATTKSTKPPKPRSRSKTPSRTHSRSSDALQRRLEKVYHREQLLRAMACVGGIKPQHGKSRGHPSDDASTQYTRLSQKSGMEVLRMEF